MKLKRSMGASGDVVGVWVGKAIEEGGGGRGGGGAVGRGA